MTESKKASTIEFKTNGKLKKKGIEVTDEEMDKQIEEAAQGMGVDPAQAKQNLAGIMDNLEFSVKMDKAVQFLVDQAKIEEFEMPEANDEEPESSSDE